MNLKKAIEILKKNIKREKPLTVISILVLTLTFLTFNFFVFSVMGTNVILYYLENRAQVNIYFEDSAGEEKILKIKNDLLKDSRISLVKYVTKEEALKIFTSYSKDEPALLESVKSNPLPASLEVKAKNISDLKQLSTEFEKLEGVIKVKFYEDIVNTFRKWSFVLRVSSFIFLFVLAVVSVVLIFITVGSTINSKGVEIEIMKLVGASDSYVKNPLLLQGVFYGVSASIFSAILLLVSLPFFKPVINLILKGVQTGDSWWVLVFWDPIFKGDINIFIRAGSIVLIILLQILMGSILGYVASLLAIKKHLK